MALVANPNGNASAVDSGLPCEVQSFLQASCWQCHGQIPSGGAPMSIVTLADLQAPAVTVPSESTGQLSVERMHNTKSPMPPDGILDPTVRSVLESWVAGGMQAGSCQIDGGTDPYATPTVCTSGKTSSSGRESSTMLPGEACISCHQQNRGPRFSIGGTAYPTAHEPDDCIGASGIQVVITDANNQVLTLTANQAGNFYSQRSVALPYHAKVVAGGNERAMSAAQTSGDCNSCHTEQGTSQAPGRIMAP
jgi:hypothetical protein